jgi:Flp pilus assembly protein TadB
MHTAPATPPTPERREPGPTFSELLWAMADIAGGAAVMLLPLLLLAVPGIIVFVVLPALVLLTVAAAPVVVAGAILTPTYLLTRSVRRLVGTRRDTRHRSLRRREAVAPC